MPKARPRFDLQVPRRSYKDTPVQDHDKAIVALTQSVGGMFINTTLKAAGSCFDKHLKVTAINYISADVDARG